MLFSCSINPKLPSFAFIASPFKKIIDYITFYKVNILKTTDKKMSDQFITITQISLKDQNAREDR